MMIQYIYKGVCVNVIFGSGRNKKDGREPSVVFAVVAESGSVRRQFWRGKNGNETERKKQRNEEDDDEEEEKEEVGKGVGASG